eukprot:scaffold118316_cov18-Tisochrysis_lutea.AAC.4
MQLMHSTPCWSTDMCARKNRIPTMLFGAQKGCTRLTDMGGDVHVVSGYSKEVKQGCPSTADSFLPSLSLAAHALCACALLHHS